MEYTTKPFLPLLLALTCTSVLLACTTDADSPQSQCDDQCDTLGIAPVGSELLFTFSAADEVTLAAEIAEFGPIFDEHMSSIGYFPEETLTSRGTRGGSASLEFETFPGITWNGNRVPWIGYFEPGGSLSKETYANGTEIIILDFGSDIFTADGLVVASNIDRFGRNQNGQRAALSNNISTDGGRATAIDKSGMPLRGAPGDVAITAKTAMSIDAQGAASVKWGAEADTFFTDFLTAVP